MVTCFLGLLNPDEAHTDTAPLPSAFSSASARLSEETSWKNRCRDVRWFDLVSRAGAIERITSALVEPAFIEMLDIWENRR